MNWWRRLLRTRKLESELDMELRDHIERLAADYIGAGTAEADARRRARLEFGGLTQMQEECRDARGTVWMQSCCSNLRLAWRNLRKDAAFTAIAVITIGLGVGANTAAFSVADAILFNPLPYRGAERIVALSNVWLPSGATGPVSIPDFRDWRDRGTAFAAMAYYTDYDSDVAYGASAEYAHVTRASSGFFDVFGVEPLSGRLFAAEEEQPGAAGAALIGYSYWRKRFAGNPAVLGQTIRVFGKALPIVGILPEAFDFPNRTDIWCPADTAMRETAVRSAPNYFAAGLLKPGVSLDSAQAQLTAIAAQLEQQYPDANRGKTVSLTPMREVLVGNSRRTLYLLLGAVAVVLLIAIANLANLLIARFTGRRQEIAVRTALGAGLARTIGQFMAENLLLASLGGTAGLVLASRGWRALAGIWPGNAPLLARAGIDARVLVFTSAILMAVLILSLVPTIYAAQVDASDALRESAASVAVSRRAARLGGLLVSAEVALAVVLLTGAGLFLKSLLSLENVDLGYRPDNVLVMRTSVPASDFHSAQRSARLYKTLLSRLATLPGIQAVGAVRLLPGHAGSFGPYWIDRQSPVESADLTAPQAVYSIVAPRTFAALGIPLPGGRDFDSQDTYDAPFVAIVNRRLAGAAFHGQNPIGRTILCNFDSRRPMTIIGIAGDVQEYGPASPPRPEIYMPYEQHPSPSSALSLVARTVASLESSPDLQRRIVHEVPPGVPVEITTMKASLSHDRAGPRFRAAVLSAFAALALILAIGGVYGVTAYTIKQRSAEIGLRVALGAAPGDILISVLRQGFLLIARGIALGLVAALALSHLFAEMLFEVKPLDPVIHLSVVVLLCASGLAASYFAARRAAFCDPMTVLRHL